MSNQIYFDEARLRRGDFYNLLGDISTGRGGSYELEEWIGRGGNATVFRGRRRSTGDECAIKFLLNTSDRSKRRFRREIELLGKIADEHITRYFGAGHAIVSRNKGGREEELPFVVMELADSNLQDVVQAEGAISYERYAGQFRGLAKALASLHDHAIHRDIKPENILVAGDRWLLSDYGLCTFVDSEVEELTVEGENLGPKFWLSPEAHNFRLGCGDTISTASDVYQLAAIFWYVATGRHPSGMVTERDWIGPRKLFGLIYRSLLHDCRRRPQHGQAFFVDLVDALAQ